MANIKVKIKDGTEVLYDNIDTLVLPTTDGVGAVFRKWNGISGTQMAVRVVCKNIIRQFEVQYPSTEITIFVG